MLSFSMPRWLVSLKCSGGKDFRAIRHRSLIRPLPQMQNLFGINVNLLLTFNDQIITCNFAERYYSIA